MTLELLVDVLRLGGPYFLEFNADAKDGFDCYLLASALEAARLAPISCAEGIALREAVLGKAKNWPFSRALIRCVEVPVVEPQAFVVLEAELGPEYAMAVGYDEPRWVFRRLLAFAALLDALEGNEGYEEAKTSLEKQLARVAGGLPGWDDVESCAAALRLEINLDEHPLVGKVLSTPFRGEHS